MFLPSTRLQQLEQCSHICEHPILGRRCEHARHHEKNIEEFWHEHSDAKDPLEAWYRLTKKAQWANLAETRADFPHADPYGKCTIFNIGGNKYRLITSIHYNRQRVYIVSVLTHKEYDKEKWKNVCNC